MPYATRHPGAILAAFAIRAVSQALELSAAQAGPCPGHRASAGHFALRRPGHGPASGCPWPTATWRGADEPSSSRSRPRRGSGPSGEPRSRWKFSPAVIHQLATCAWVKAGHPLCLIGDSGTGKSHLLIGLGAAAAEAAHRVRYMLASKLVNEPAEAADDKQLSKTTARYGRLDLLCLDELGYMELDRRGAELLFQVLTEREERCAIAIASNEPFSGWTKTFTDPRLCAAIVDRLTFAGQIIETGTASYRLPRARQRRAARSATQSK